VLVVSNLGSRERRGSLIVPWSNDTRRAGIGLQRTVADSIREELDEEVGATGWIGQLFRLSFPLGIGAQGAFLDRGFDAVRISGSGELPDGGTPDEDVLGGLGRATLRSVTALDEGRRPEHGPESYVTAVSQVLPGWIIGLIAIAFLAPVIITSVDAFARARRRRMPVGPWFRWLATWIVPFLAALAAAGLLALAGATPDPPSNPVAPSDNPLDVPAAAVLLGVAVAAALAFLAARALARRSGELEDPAEPGAACALGLVAAAAALVLWLVNPYTALMLVPAAHLWMLATLVDPGPPRRARAVMVAVGLLPLLLVALYHLVVLRMDPITGAWYVLLLVTGGGVELTLALLGCVWLGCLAATVAIVRATPEAEPPAPEERSTVFGPGAHAGPGALGGTESALRR
jgi:MFS family permease